MGSTKSKLVTDSTSSEDISPFSKSYTLSYDGNKINANRAKILLSKSVNRIKDVDKRMKVIYLEMTYSQLQDIMHGTPEWILRITNDNHIHVYNRANK